MRGEALMRIADFVIRLQTMSVMPTAAALARDYGVSERTIRRYLAALRDRQHYVPPSQRDMARRMEGY